MPSGKVVFAVSDLGSHWPLGPKSKGHSVSPGLFGQLAGHSLCSRSTSAGLLSVLDLSAQAVIYEVATVVYMVRLMVGTFCSAPSPTP